MLLRSCYLKENNAETIEIIPYLRKTTTTIGEKSPKNQNQKNICLYKIQK